MIWKELVAALIRYVIVAVAGALVGRGVVGDDLASRIIEPATGAVVGVLIFALPVLWRYAVARFNALEKERLFTSNPANHSRADITKQTYDENSFVLPV